MPTVNIKFTLPDPIPDDISGAYVVRSTTLKSEKAFQTWANIILGPNNPNAGLDFEDENYQDLSDIDSQVTLFPGSLEYNAFLYGENAESLRTEFAGQTLTVQDTTAETGQTYWYCVLAEGVPEELGSIPWFKAGVFYAASTSEVSPNTRKPTESSVASITLGALTAPDSPESTQIVEVLPDTENAPDNFTPLPVEIYWEDQSVSGVLRDSTPFRDTIEKAVGYWSNTLSSTSYNDNQKLKVFVYIRENYLHKSKRNRWAPIYTEAADPRNVGGGFSGVMPGAIIINIDEGFANLQKTLLGRTASNGVGGELNNHFYHIIRRELLRGLGIGDQYFGDGDSNFTTEWSGGVPITETSGVFYYTGPVGKSKYTELFSVAGVESNPIGIPIEWRSNWLGTDVDRASGIEGAFASYGWGGPYGDELNSLNHEHSYLQGVLTNGEISTVNPILYDSWYESQLGPAVSAITLGVLEDRGFEVNYDNEESYTPDYSNID